MKMTAKIFIGLLGAILAFVFVFYYFIQDKSPTLTLSATNLMEGITSEDVTTEPTSETFGPSFTNLSSQLFKKSYSEDQNILISPLVHRPSHWPCVKTGLKTIPLAQMEKVILDMPVTDIEQ